MITREQIVDEALSWEGTPFKDQQCLKGHGVDCAMLAFGVAANLGLVDRAMRKKIGKYSPEWHLHQNESTLIKAMEEFGCEKVNYHDMQPGDIVVFKYHNTVSHLGIIVGYEEDTWQIIHAVKGSIKRVVLSSIADDLERRWRGAYRFPGIE